MIAPVSSVSSSAHSCAVCGVADARALASTTLASGAVVIVCGSHAVAHGRCERPARTVRELWHMLADRRVDDDRRGRGYGDEDELARSLASAFGGERRASGRRAADA